MVWALLFILAGGALAYVSLRSEQRNKIHLSRNNWSSFWNGAAFFAGINLAIAYLLTLL